MQTQAPLSNQGLSQPKQTRPAFHNPSRHQALTQHHKPQLHWRCATQTKPAYSVGRSPSPRSRTLACIQTTLVRRLMVSTRP